jgi:hypothetical protein
MKRALLSQIGYAVFICICVNGATQISAQEIAVPEGVDATAPVIVGSTPIATEGIATTGPGDLILESNDAIPELMSGIIDNRRVYNHFVRRGQKLIADDRILDDKEVLRLLEGAPRCVSRAVPLAQPLSSGPFSNDAVHERCKKASLMIGTLYDCGRCNNLHANLAGAVAISADGIALTNYHVLERNEGNVKGLVAMNYQGECFAIAEVLAASKANDIALIRLATDRPLDPVPIANVSPKPMSPIFVLSHPHNEFFVVSTGVVSRLAKGTMTGDSTTWLEVTAEFSGGSSGSGIFNAEGELVGLVSRIHPLFRNERGAADSPLRGDLPTVYVEQILRRCVPVESIRSLIE